MNFLKRIDVKSLLAQAQDLFKSATLPNTATDNEVRGAFFATPSDGDNGTHGFIAKAVCSILLDNNLQTSSSGDCSLM